MASTGRTALTERLRLEGVRSSWSWPLGIAAALAVLILRRPEAVTRAEFHTEDGQVFYLGTYFGDMLDRLLRSYNGYLHLGPRLVAETSRLAPIEQAPLVANVISLLVVALIATYVTSPRLSHAFPEAGLRLVIGLFVVALPVSQETLGSMTYLQFYFGIFLLALVAADPFPRRLIAALEIAGVVVIAFTGPIGAILAPVFVTRALMTRDRRKAVLAGILVVGAVVQVITFVGAGDRQAAAFQDPLSVAAVALVRGVDVALLGQFVSKLITDMQPHVGLVALVTVSLAGGLVLAVWRAFPPAGRALLGYGWAALMVPGIAIHHEPVILLLGNPYFEGRYFLVPGAIVGLIVITALWRLSGRARWLAVGLAAILVVGIVGDLRLIPRPDHDWPTRSACIGGPLACEVPVEPTYVWTIRWPGSGGRYSQLPSPPAN